MGTINHYSVIATTFDKKEFDRVGKWVATKFAGNKIISLFTFVDGLANGYHTIMMAPDGSKEGWGRLAADARKSFIAEMEKANYSDGSSPWSYVQVEFGDSGQRVTKGNNE